MWSLYPQMSQPTNDGMTIRIICSLLSLAALAACVRGYDDRWENAVNIPEDADEEMIVRESRVPPLPRIEHVICTCESVPRFMDFGHRTYPRHLVSNDCIEKRLCVDFYHFCEEITYTLNVTTFRDSKEYSSKNNGLRRLLGEATINDCVAPVPETVVKTITAACRNKIRN